MSLRDQLLGCFQRRYLAFEVAGLALCCRNLNEGEKSQFEAGTVTDEGKINLAAMAGQRRRLIKLCLVDPESHAVLLDQPGDAEKLKELDAAVTTAIFDVCRKHCGFDVEDAAKKNSAATAAGDSPTA